MHMYHNRRSCVLQISSCETTSLEASGTYITVMLKLGRTGKGRLGIGFLQLLCVNTETNKSLLRL